MVEAVSALSARKVSASEMSARAAELRQQIAMQARTEADNRPAPSVETKRAVRQTAQSDAVAGGGQRPFIGSDVRKIADGKGEPATPSVSATIIGRLVATLRAHMQT